MLKLDSLRTKHRVAELGLSTEELSKRADIPYGTLRNAVAGRDPINLRRAYRLLEALNPPGRARILIEDLLARGEKPSDSPNQPVTPKGPPRRQDHDGKKTGPKRHNEAAA
ncbi:helix-turn-helix domain-containing protein [Sciscionella sediminilitoris]|uniref:helix-turn-helix domain-containing protein n=1 Tax=Sciscionella sediminilitoris TaxID=1445613 RepID=UPI0012E1F505|nr:helix-turn-helix transcriptional regulator [Sciscionella sp. SE31]